MFAIFRPPDVPVTFEPTVNFYGWKWIAPKGYNWKHLGESHLINAAKRFCRKDPRDIAYAKPKYVVLETRLCDQEGAQAVADYLQKFLLPDNESENDESE